MAFSAAFWFLEINKMRKENGEKTFSIELKSKEQLKTINLVTECESVLIEGTIGQLQQTKFVENILLVVTGSKGVLRIDLTPDQIGVERKSEVKKI